MYRPCTYACINTTKTERSSVYGISQREKHFNDIRATCQSEISVWEQSVLAQRVLRQHSWANKEAIAQYIKNQEQEDMMRDQLSLKELVDPFKGSK
jgi:hypothetical protein